MKIIEIIERINKECTWKNFCRKTRDRVLVGDANQEVDRVIICWVATHQVIDEAIQKGIHFIISHENPFYASGTNMETAMYEAIENKKEKCEQNQICIYRCHDVWDLIPNYGVSDVWASKLGYNFEPRKISSYYQVATIDECKVSDIAQHVANVLSEDGEEGCYVYGNVNKKVSRIAIGTGAATNIFDVLEFCPDAVIVSDDGITNFTDAQFAIDQNIPLIVVNHAGCEIGGLKNMVLYFEDKMPQIHAEYVDEGFHISYYVHEK